MGPERPLYPVPNMKDGMGAHYHGLYAKTFFASSLNGDYRSRSTIARKHEYKTREDNNMLGMTNKYDQETARFESPIKFEKIKERDPFANGQVFGPHN